MYSIQHYVTKFVSELRQVSGFPGKRYQGRKVFTSSSCSSLSFKFLKYSYKVSIGISTFYFLQPFIFFSIFHIFFVLLFEASRSLAAIFSWFFLKLLFICLLNAFAFKLNSSFVLSDLSNLYLSLSLQNERNLSKSNF